MSVRSNQRRENSLRPMCNAWKKECVLTCEGLYVCVLTRHVWAWMKPEWWLIQTGNRTGFAGQPGCSWGPSWGRDTGGAAEHGFGDGAEEAGDAGAGAGAGAGAEAGVWAGAGSYRTGHCGKASAWRSRSDIQLGLNNLGGHVCILMLIRQCLHTCM